MKQRIWTTSSKPKTKQRHALNHDGAPTYFRLLQEVLSAATLRCIRNDVSGVAAAGCRVLAVMNW